MKSQIQFNWIFVLIAGAVILLFFTGFALKYKDLQEKKQEIIFLNNFDKTLTNLQSSSFKTSTSLELPLDVNINCGEIYINEKYSTTNLLFSPDKLKKKIYVWYYLFEYPFKITNFYFMIDEKGIDIQTNDPSLINELIQEMPEEFRSRIRVGSTGRRIDIVGDMNYGSVIINGQSYNYYGKGLLYGALFSDDYECLLNKVNQRFEESVNNYQNKIAILQRGGCDYNLINNKLNELKSNKGVAEDIEKMNENLASLNCAVVY